MNRLRPFAAQRRFDRALVLGAVCVAACTGGGPDHGDGGDAAQTNAEDSQPYDATFDQTRPAADGPLAESSADRSSPGADSSSGSSSSGGDASNDSSSSGSSSSGSSGGDGSSGMDASVDATLDTGADTAVEANNDASGCAKRTTMPNQVVMLGDSYLDPLFSAAGNDIVADAQNAGALATNMTYRHYYMGGAALLNTGAGTLNIPYQWMQATMDPTVQQPSNIDTVIMDGGASDFILVDRSCLYAPPTYDATTCYMTIQMAINKLTSLMQDMASKGVKHIVYFFYPHLDPSGGGLLTMPAPAVNDTIDYAATQAQSACELVSQCVFVDLRPAFDGNPQYISGDRLNPSAAGAQVLADLVWQTMVRHCIAQ
jgi:lysophospholipase L1-like esterase